MVIANRRPKVLDGTREIEVLIQLFKPERDGRAWSCRYEIGWPDEKRCSYASGADSVQAILLAFQKIGIELYTSDYHEKGLLSSYDPGGGYGFPLTKGARDLAVGDDKDL